MQDKKIKRVRAEFLIQQKEKATSVSEGTRREERDLNVECPRCSKVWLQLTSVQLLLYIDTKHCMLYEAEHLIIFLMFKND